MPRATGPSRRQGGRSSRARSHKAGQADRSPAIPLGAESGRYLPLSQDELDEVHAATLDIMETVGMADASPAWTERIIAAGGFINEHGRLCFPPDLVNECIERTRDTVQLAARDPRHDLDVGGRRVYFGGGGGAVMVQDLETGEYRNSTLNDVYDMARLQDSLPNCHFYLRACIARELEDTEELDLNTAFASMKGTSKHVFTSFFDPSHVRSAVRMADMAAGGDGSGATFRARPTVSLVAVVAVPPLRFATETCSTIDAAVEEGMPILLLTAGQAGATAPAHLAGALVQGNVEVLSSLVAVSLLEPDHPVIYSNWTLSVDLRTGGYAVGAVEGALIQAAAAQLANRYGLPNSVMAGSSSAKILDAQAGYEKGILSSLAGLSGGNLVFHSCGLLADVMVASYEATVLDSDMQGMNLRGARGIEVTSETTGRAAIREAVLGPGHFLGSADTLEVMTTEFFYPQFANRSSVEDWLEQEDKDVRASAREHARRVLEEHQPSPPIGKEAEDQIRRDFPIRLPTDV